MSPNPIPRVLGFLTLLCLAVSCGDDGVPSTPNIPSRSPAGVAISTLNGSLAYSGTDKRYSIRLSVRETSGQTGATMGTVELTYFSDATLIATSRVEDAWTTTRLNPGATLDAKTMIATDSQADRPAANRVTARVNYVDDLQTSSSSTTSADISQPASSPPSPALAFFTLAGVLSEDPDGVPIGGGRVEVIGGVNAGRSSGTDGNGYYSIGGLQNTTFRVRASKAGYQSVDRVVTLSSDTRFDNAVAADSSGVQRRVARMVRGVVHRIARGRVPRMMA